jgi:hypothetical protein
MAKVSMLFQAALTTKGQKYGLPLYLFLRIYLIDDEQNTNYAPIGSFYYDKYLLCHFLLTEQHL